MTSKPTTTNLGAMKLRPPRKSPRRIAMSSLMMFLSAAVLCVWVTVHRDHRIRQYYMDSTEANLKALQEHLDRYGRLPARVPDSLLLRNTAPLEFYADEGTRYYAQAVTEPVVIGYSRMAELFATYHGRGVIFFENGKLRAEWMHEGVFQRLWTAQEKARDAFIERAREAPVDLSG